MLLINLIRNSGPRDRKAAWAKSHSERVNAKNRRWRAANPDKVRSYQRKLMYGVTQGDYDAMLERQRGLCAVCQGPPRVKTFLLVDHCHRTGVVRGLLCQPCNVGIGHLGDDAGRLMAAADYLSVSR